MRRLCFLTLSLVLIGCGADTSQTSSAPKKAPTTQPTTTSTSRPASRPVVRKWKPMPLSQNEVNIIVIGDWGNNKDAQKKTAATMASYVAATGRPFNATLLAGDNFYVKLSGVLDYQWQSLFEDM